MDEKPVSEQGATQVARFTIGLQGPHLLREVELLRNHPVGQRLLMAPSQVVCVDEVPELGSGKIDFSALNKLAGEMMHGASAPANSS